MSRSIEALIPFSNETGLITSAEFRRAPEDANFPIYGMFNWVTDSPSYEWKDGADEYSYQGYLTIQLEDFLKGMLGYGLHNGNFIVKTFTSEAEVLSYFSIPIETTHIYFDYS